ncbi:MAG: TIGR03619 family F420-dependent LLM class oxidoreductase [Thermomicrobiales bacterium]
MRFGYYLPTCAEGTFYPRGFVDLGWIAETSRQVEDAGFYELSVSDYVSTGRRNRNDALPPPQYLEPITMLAWLAGQTSRIHLLTNVLVMPLREPVLLAKELTTLDQVSNGRLICGLGLGANRDEFESIHPRRSGMDRGRYLSESIEALRVLLSERISSYSGKSVEFNEVELFPKAVQQPLPIYLTGDSEDACRRAAQSAEGWITFVPGTERIAALLGTLDEEAKAANRERPVVAPMIAVAIGETDEAALEYWSNAQFCAHLKRGRNQPPEELAKKNLVGTAETIVRTIGEYEDVGVNHMTLIFTGNTTAEVGAQITAFIDEVLPRLPAVG